MHYLICYDIAHNPTRTRVSKLLLRQGCLRLQKSVFLAVAFPPAEIGRLRELLALETPLQGPDSLLLFPTDGDHLKSAFCIGHNEALQQIRHPSRSMFF